MEIRHLTLSQQAELRSMTLIYVERFRQLLARGIQEGIFRPCDIKFTVLQMVSVAIPLAQWFRHDGRLTIDEVVAAYTDYCVRGVLNTPVGPTLGRLTGTLELRDSQSHQISKLFDFALNIESGSTVTLG